MTDSSGVAGWPLVLGPEDWCQWSTPDTLTDGLDAVAALIALRWDHHRQHNRAMAALVDVPLPDPVLLVGLAGPVASGKSTVAAALADRLRGGRSPIATEVLTTDGFLRPNADLDAAGLTLRKGFPESYDHDAIRHLVAALRRGDSRITTPVYSHITYDIADEDRQIDRPRVLIIEGVNALQSAPDGGAGPGDLIDVALFIDVAETTVIEWFVERFFDLTIAARADPTSFYGLWAELSDDEVRRSAREVWHGINGVNLREHIEPSRQRATIEMVTSPDHDVTELRLHG